MGKKLRDEDLVLNIVVNGDKGRKEMGQLEKAIRSTKTELTALEKQELRMRKAQQQESAEYKAVTAAIQQKNRALTLATGRLTQLQQGMDLNKMSVTDLRREMTRLAKLRDIAAPGTAGWKKHDAELKKVVARYHQLRGTAQQTGGIMSSITSKFSQLSGSVMGYVASIGALIAGVKKSTDHFVEFDDKIADAEKTTGLTKDEVLELNEALKDTNNIDTRTSQEDLLGLLRVAGKLGLEGKKNLLGFIKAGDEIGVSLAEDLGGDVEEAINIIGKLVDVFDIDNEFGIETAMRKTGSLINELGASSAASEGEIVDFINRLAGIAPSANISIDKVAGLGSMLSQMNQSMEVAGTTFVNVIPKMFTETDKFARIAGMGIEDFTALLNKDANEALLRFLEGLNGNNEGMAYMMNLLQSLGLEGSRAKNILSVLANNTGKLRSEQELANKAFVEGNSILKEFETKNNNVAAKLEKAQKGVKNMWVEIGSKLYPIVLDSTSLFEKFLRIVSALIDFVKENRIVIVSLTAAVVAYNVALAAQSALTQAAIIKQRLLNLVMKQNPVLLFVSAITAIGTALYLYTRRTKEAIDAADEFNKMQKKANSQVSGEESRIKALMKVARDKTKLDGERKEAIKDLIALNPSLLGGLSLETINTDSAAEAVKRYIQTKRDQYLVDELVAKQQEIIAKKQDLRNEIDAKNESITTATGRGAPSMKRAAKEAIEAKKEEIAQLEKLELANEAKLIEIYEREAANKAAIAERSAAELAKIERAQRAKSANERTKKELDEIEAYRNKILLESKSLVEQENLAHKERLKQAGLANKDRLKMTAADLSILEALEAKHKTNLAKIDEDALAAEISRYESSFDQQLNALKIAQNNQLAAFAGNAADRKALIAAQTAEEEQLVKENLENLQTLIVLALDKGNWEGITADDVLSDEEYELLKSKLDEIGLSLSEAGLKKGSSDEKSEKGKEDEDEGGLNYGLGSTDILGFTQDDWDQFFENLKSGEAGVSEILMAVNALSDGWNLYNDMVTESERSHLENYERSVNSRIASNEKQMQAELKAAYYSRSRQAKIKERYAAREEALLDSVEQKKAEAEYKQARRDKASALMSAIVNTAAAVAKSLPNIPLSVLVGFLGAAQIAKIASTPLPEVGGREDGGYLSVRRSQDKKIFRAKSDPDKRGYVDQPTIIAGENGREFVASNAAYNNPEVRPILDHIDTAQRNGTINTIKLKTILQDREAIKMQGRERGGYVSDQIPSLAKETSVDKSELLKMTYNIMLKLSAQLERPIKSDVSLLGQNGFIEQLDKYNRIISDSEI